MGQIDNLSFSYWNTGGQTNQLREVSETAPATFRDYGFRYNGYGEYTYDDNGNLIYDPNKNINVQYNYLNLPRRITFEDCQEVEFVYDASGAKLRKLVKDGSMVLSTHDYIGGVEYKNEVLEAIYHSEGRVYFEDGTARYEYTITDHLGNSRLTFTDKDGDGKIDMTDDPVTNEVLQENHYYPFGMAMEGQWIGDPGRENKYRYNGIERNEDFNLNWDLAEFRSFDATIGRWNQVDPLSEIASELTPYRFGFNNPIKFFDPLGLFETRREARAWARNNGVRTGWFTNGRIRKGRDGTFSVITTDSESGVRTSTNHDPETAELLGNQSNGDGTVTSVTISPTDPVQTGNNSFFTVAGWETRDGLMGFPEHDRPMIIPAGGATQAGARGVTMLGGNLNGNKAVGQFVNYVFRNGKEILKVGKADAGRTTKSTGLPTRVHQQWRKLKKMYPNLEVSINPLGRTTTANAKKIERSILKKIYEKLGYVPKGNAKSFKPKK